jgi:hypothetical protein
MRKETYSYKASLSQVATQKKRMHYFFSITQKDARKQIRHSPLKPEDKIFCEALYNMVFDIQGN